MKKYILFSLIMLKAVTAFAQTRSDIQVYISPVKGTPEQAAFFMDNFTMETQGAGYTVTNNISHADYILNLEVQPNVILYDDGTTEPAPPGEPQYNLIIKLEREEDDVEVLAFSFQFTELDEMYDYNLYLLYNAMANVPFTKLGDIEYWWRNKWVYFRASFDYPVTFYQLKSQNRKWNPSDEREQIPIDNKIIPFPAVTFGVEFQYLNWMSTEMNFNLSFNDPMSNSFIPSIQIEQKFPIKPSKHFMLEPYAAVSFPMDTSSNVVNFPKFGVGGGFQFGVKGGNMGAFFVDVNYIYYLGNVTMRNSDSHYSQPTNIDYTRFVLGLGIGYKFGLFNRPK
jgi:hypothetical protein